MQLIPDRDTDGLKARVFHRLSACLDQGRTEPVAVGLSGGGDSHALLALVCEWAKAAGRPVLALTVDHHLNPQSADWTKRAGKMARALGADWQALHWHEASGGSGIQARARQARHALLAHAARDAGAAMLLLGHTADDAAENEWMRADGTSVGQLRPWSPSPVWPDGRGVTLLRPLLSERRDVLRDFLCQQGLDWIDDPANEDAHYSRVRARQALNGDLPQRAPEPLHPFDGRDLETALMASDATHLGILQFSRQALLEAPDRILSMALLCVSGGNVPPRGPRLEQLKQRLASGKDGVAVLSGTRVQMQGDTLTLMREAGEQKRAGLLPLNLPLNETVIWDGRFAVRTAKSGQVIVPAGGRLNRLDKKHRHGLSALPAAARSSLPILYNFKINQYVPAWIEADICCLVGPRLRWNCRLWTDETPQEGALFDLWHGETVPTVLFSE